MEQFNRDDDAHERGAAREKEKPRIAGFSIKPDAV
jgi:hypothetical protein